MRRAQSQSARHFPRPSLNLGIGADDLGVLREGDESAEDILRRQLLDKDRENDRLQTQIQLLQNQLAQRPPIEKIQELEREYKTLELLLEGTQRDNERCMTDIERGKQREKALEGYLTRLAGENWKDALGVDMTTSASSNGISSPIPTRTVLMHQHQRSHTVGSSPLSLSTSTITSTSPSYEQQQQQQRVTPAQIEQLRMLILGMEQRLKHREEKLGKIIEEAQDGERRFEGLKREVDVSVQAASNS